MLVSMIVAHDENRVIGHRNKLPWHIPSELRHFKNMTIGKTVVMGRKTYESIGRPLPDRVNIVLSRQTDYNPLGATRVSDLETALLTVKTNEVVIIGGQQIYEQALHRCDRLYVTKVKGAFEGDAYFPAYEGNFRLLDNSNVREDNGYMYQTFLYERKFK